jgi:serine/threonine protein kinase/tetratricopeptide (TPR) repeat protein
MIGRALSHYEITAKLGEGGMGEVWRATDTALNREVAVKVLPEEMAADPERLERFKREAQAIAALNHPNIVTIYSVEEADGVHLLTMELVEGKSLDQMLPPSGFDLDQLFPLAIQIADALAAAHEKGIVHRDLKPANVIVTGDGRVKVLDFGLAKLAEQEETAEETQLMTEAGMVLGTVPYMSPEQVQAKPVDHRSDVFSLGTLLYEMATGERPFRGDNPASVISAVLKDQPPLVTAVKADLPNHLGRIVRRCLEKDPDLRYRSAKNLHHELETLHDEVKSGQSAVKQALSSEQSARPVPRAGAPPGPVLKKLGLAIGAAAILGIAGFWVLRSPSEDRSAPTSTAAAPPPIAVVGFENLSDPDDSQQLGRMLMSLITTDLAESGGLEVASSAKVLASLKTATGGSGRFDTALAAEAAKLAGAEVMLAGQLMSDGERLLLTAELVNVATGNTLGSIRQDAADRSELFGLADAIAGEVRDQLGIAAGSRSGEAIDLARVLTDSAEAYRLYVTGEQALHDRRFEDAVHDFGLAVREDPSFALARYKQSMAAWWGGSAGDRREILEDGLPASERLPERWQKVYRAYLHVEEGEAEEAYALLNEVLERSDTLPDAYNLRGEIRWHYNRYRDYRAARSDLERALKLDPSFKLVFYHLLDSYAYVNDLAAAERLIARYREEDPDDRVIIFGETRIAAARRDFEEAARLGREELRRGGSTAWEEYLASLDRAGLDDESRAAKKQYIGGHRKGNALLHRGLSSFWNGRFEQALADFDESTLFIATAGQPADASVAVEARFAHALALWIVGKRAEAIDSARQAITIDPWHPAAHYLLGRFLFEAGREAEGDRALAAFEEMKDESYSPYPAYWLKLLRADRALTNGDSSPALSELGRLEGADADPLMRSFQRVSEGAALEASGDLEAALVPYRKAADPPELFWAGPFSLEIPALYHVARLEEALGDHDAAREYYQRYLDRWGEADLPIPEVLQAKARLAAL